MRWLAMVTCSAALAGACAHRPPNPQQPTSGITGAYVFEELNGSGPFHLSGSVTLRSGDATLQLNRSYCRGVHAVPEGSFLVFSCAGEIDSNGGILSNVRIVIDRQNPDEGSTWSGSKGAGDQREQVGGRLHVSVVSP